MDAMNDRGHPKKKWSTAFRVLQTVNRFKQIPEKKEKHMNATENGHALDGIPKKEE
uniref:Uncharacterized protein n=1 Tax=Acrobeloides nanus TaxID=290746 RepID=A0A914E783_9BILA